MPRLKAKPAPRGAQGSEGPTAIRSYMRDVSRDRVLSADEERTLARDIAGLRTQLWRHIFDYPPFVGPICELVAQEHADNLDGGLGEALEALASASRAYRDRETRKNCDRFHDQRRTTAELVASVDVDNVAADRVAADLAHIASGRKDGVSMKVTFPPRKSRPFAEYRSRVEATNRSLRLAKHRFVTANLRLVISIAHRFDYGLLPMPDLIQEGNLGLIKAVDRFDPERGFRFSTYASWWIRHAINRALANKGRTVRLPAHVTADQHKMVRARREFETQQGRAPTHEELAELTGLSLVRVKKLRRLPLEPALSLDLPVGDDESRTLIDVVADDSFESPTDKIDQEAISEALHEAFDGLQPIEIDILSKRFGLDDDSETLTLRELGERHSLSRERIRQLQERALLKLRRVFEDRELDLR